MAKLHNNLHRYKKEELKAMDKILKPTQITKPKNLRTLLASSKLNKEQSKPSNLKTNLIIKKAS